MKQLYLALFYLLFIIIPVKASYVIDFGVNGSTELPDSVKVQNLTQGTEIYLTGDQQLLLLTDRATSIDLNSDSNEEVKIYPHPFTADVNVEFYNREGGRVVTTIYDLYGRSVCSNCFTSSQGTVKQVISGLKVGQYVLQIRTDSQSFNKLLISTGTTDNPRISYISTIASSLQENLLKSAEENQVELSYNDGDILNFTGYKNVNDSCVVEMTVTESQTVSFDFLTVYKGSISYTSHENWSNWFSSYGFMEPEGIELDRTAAQAGYNSVYGFNIPEDNQQVGFKWNTEDTESENWYAQGISGFKKDGKRFLIVSWYAKEYQGSRISLVDITDMDNIKYTHILLVQSRSTQTSTVFTQLRKFRPLTIHAGGVAYHNGKLFVASTSLGIRVFDMSKIVEVSTGNASTSIGWDDSDNQIYGFGYRYILPQVGYYRISEGNPFSCISLSYGETDDDVRLTTGQYLTSGNPLVYSFYLNEEGEIDVDQKPEVFNPEDMYGGPVYRVQGVFTKSGKMILTTTGNNSYLGSTARLNRYEAGSPCVRYRWSHGAEDLYYEASEDLLWNCTEYPTSTYGQDNRCVFGVRLTEDYW